MPAGRVHAQETSGELRWRHEITQVAGQWMLAVVGPFLSLLYSQIIISRVPHLGGLCAGDDLTQVRVAFLVHVFGMNYAVSRVVAGVSASVLMVMLTGAIPISHSFTYRRGAATIVAILASTCLLWTFGRIVTYPGCLSAWMLRPLW
jgi:hypothetical protein